MNVKLIILVLMYSIISGCSVADYIAMEDPPEKAMERKDLGNDPEYSSFLNRPVQLKPLRGVPWKLKKYDGGRYHIEMYTKYSKKEIVCDLSEGGVEITEIFSDAATGEVFYSATVLCEGTLYYTPLNSWSGALKSSIGFTGDKNT